MVCFCSGVDTLSNGAATVTSGGGGGAEAAFSSPSQPAINRVTPISGSNIFERRDIVQAFIAAIVVHWIRRQSGVYSSLAAHLWTQRK
jgi:hypothetical protein